MKLQIRGILSEWNPPVFLVLSISMKYFVILFSVYLLFHLFYGKKFLSSHASDSRKLEKDYPPILTLISEEDESAHPASFVLGNHKRR